MTAGLWSLPPAPAERLAALRIITGLGAVGYLLFRLPVFIQLTDRHPSTFEPVGVLAVLEQPPARWLALALLIVTILSGALFTAGLWFRLSGPLFGCLLLITTTYHSSWGQLLWFENLMVLHILIIGLSPAAHAYRWHAPQSENRVPAVRYGIPVALAGIATVATYVIAGIAKVRYGGVDWLMGDTLRNHVAFSAARLDVLGGHPSPIAPAFLEHSWLFAPFAALTVALELGAPVALLPGRGRNVWVAATWLMHAAIAGLMLIVFHWPLFGVAFAPLYRLERVTERLHRGNGPR